MPSLKQIIYDHIKNSPRPVSRPEIEELAIASGYNASNGVRRSQELCQSGQIDRVPGRFASYTIRERTVETITLNTGETSILREVELATVHQGVESPKVNQGNLFGDLQRKASLETSYF